MEALLLVPFEVHSLIRGAAACCRIPWVKALPSHLGKSKITSCIGAVSSEEMQGELRCRCWLLIEAADTLKIHFTNITHDNSRCHLTDVSLGRSLTHNNIPLILSPILTTSSHPLTHTHLSGYGSKTLAVSNYLPTHPALSIRLSHCALRPGGVLHGEKVMKISSVNTVSSFSVLFDMQYLGFGAD